jgi:5-methylcytosine-specific restriction protein A
MFVGETIDNRTISDVFGVANMGGIRVNKVRSCIVLISNNTDPTYCNEWRDGVLHFVGMGSTGPQKLDRQNRTLAKSKRNGWTLHLFEVFEKSRYVYAGEVELAGDPYMSDQPDARADDRFVWIFPLRRKTTTEVAASALPEAEAELPDYLPFGAYGVISADLTAEHTALVNQAIDGLRVAGVKVTDQRDVDEKRYKKAVERWYEEYLDHVRATVRELIAKKKQLAEAEGRKFSLVDDELRINSASNEQELRAALMLVDRDEPAAMQEIFEKAWNAVPMPEAPKSLQDLAETEPMQPADFQRAGIKRVDPARFRNFT